MTFIQWQKHGMTIVLNNTIGMNRYHTIYTMNHDRKDGKCTVLIYNKFKKIIYPGNWLIWNPSTKRFFRDLNYLPDYETE